MGEPEKNSSNNENIIKSYLSSSSSLSSSCDENEDLQRLECAPPFWRTKKRLSKQLSMCETPGDMAWERRRRQFLRQERRRNGINDDVITDEDMNELKGCIELGFGFNEEDGQRLCPTIPALDLYFAVNRQFSSSPISSPASSSGSTSSSTSLGVRSSSFGSPASDSDSWKICSPDECYFTDGHRDRHGDDPEQVKTKLRHWAQAVACSLMQSSSSSSSSS